MRRTRNHRPTRKRETRCYGHKGKKNAKQRKMKCMQGYLNWSRGVETSVKEDVEKNNVDRWSCRGTKQRHKKRGSIDPLGVEKLSRRLEISRSIHQVSRSCRDYDKKKTWEARQIARYWGGVNPAFQNSFSRGEKHRHECNPTHNSTNDPINIIISQNSLSI